ncbi:MAG TPA: HAMP domain-containing sensor histidine kinase [Solirubrobacteraceae bacterium]|nr:HAMP domain-containing sensor histidine kinase [Solirubrobacteraceae bacterium]
MAEPAHAIATPPQRIGRVSDDAPETRRHARERRVARDLVELSRLRGGGERADCVPLDLATLVRAICADYPQLHIDGPKNLPVSTDSRRLARVLFALLDNAYLHGAPPVSVTYDATEIAIGDSGPGLAAGLLSRATEPFVTGERARGRGVGLGLAIAARQAALLGAELRVGNAAGGGAVVRLCFAAATPLPVAS